MAIEAELSPQHDPAIVRHVLLEEIIELYPQRLTTAELVQRVASDPLDRQEVDVGIEAIRDLRRSGFVRYRNDDQVVEPTHVALEAVKLLAR